MEGIADFLDSLIGGVDLICYSLAIGGVLWGLFVLRPWEEIDHQAKAHGILADKTIRLIYKGAFALAIVQLLKIILKVWLMAAILDRWPFPEFASTTQFIGGIIRMMLALLLAIVTYAYLRKQANSYKHWLNTALVATLLIISGAWLVHAAGRFDYRIALMSLTTVHQVAAAAWVGGIFQLI
ncbi:MAG: copper resistance protein, partial [Methyloprofundus sp.]|nr:copper resistance protein [Methyloprofundus sp.]